MEHTKGFTLIELLLSLAFFGVLIASAYPIYQATQNTNEAILAANAVEQSVHRAVLLARSGEADSAWGVKVDSNMITVFSGDTYAARDTDKDEVYTVPSNVSLSTSLEMVFAKSTGVKSGSDTISTSTAQGNGVTLIINANGVVTRS